MTLREVAASAWEHVPAAEATLDVRDSFAFEAQSGPLGQVLENLFANAVDHVGETVTITVGSLGGDADAPTGFYVADDGSGIPPERRAAVFEPGHTSDDHRTGLGRAILQQVAESPGSHATVRGPAAWGARIALHRAASV